MSYSGIRRRVALVRTGVSEKRIDSISRVKIRELGTALAVTIISEERIASIIRMERIIQLGTKLAVTIN
jgi:hypothetical protein